MRILPFRAAAIAAILSFPALAGTLPPDTPVIVDGPVTVDAGDIEGQMLRIPAERRVEFRASRERIASLADNAFLSRSMAIKARAAGLDKDPAVQRRLAQVQEAFLADLYMQHLEKTAPVVNLETRARELYLAEPARFTTAEQVHIQHILIGLNGRTRDMAEERAKQLYADIKAGKEDFLAFAARYSDDPGKGKTGGDMGYNSPNSFVDPVKDRVAKMSTKGEVAEPVESHMGFHIVKFVDRQKPRVQPFDEVKKTLMQVEKERLAKKRSEEVVTQMRSSPTVIVHLDKLDALVNPIDDVLTKAAAAEAARAAAEAAKPR